MGLDSIGGRLKGGEPGKAAVGGHPGGNKTEEAWAGGTWWDFGLVLVAVTVHSSSEMSGEAAQGLEGRVRKTLRRVFGFETFKTSLQESATMTVARGEEALKRGWFPSSLWG